MKKFLIFSLISLGFISASDAAVPQQRRGQSTATTATASSGRTTTTSARSATTSARSAVNTAPTVSARAATTGRTTVSRSSTTPAQTQTVSARAATTKGVISTGTKVATATKNVVVSEACREKYYGCMDSFCMLDNDSGGRCICSDRNAELDDILAEIEKLDQQSYQMATVGVERIEMGNDADVAMAQANAVAQSIMTEKETTERKSLDLSLWNTPITFEEEDIFGSESASPIEGKEGDALYRASNDICVAQMPECASELSMLQLMYSQQIKSDCTAYENSLKQQKNASANKLAVAEKALRDAALDQFRTANKYDLGQCTVEFKKCMTTTGGCGDDFAGCVGIAAAENATRTSSVKEAKAKQYTIKGSATQITIAASTYDTLLAKKPLCESVTNSCVAVKDQVWDTFLREVAPQIKTAELSAESNLRTSCIANISDCFQKACKDTIDPNDPEGSYDLCLSRPETVASLCKVQIDPCVAAEPLILDFVYARLASMRVDACTNQVKECLQSEDRCGEDYTQCVGLDTDTIIRMCPADKLTACQEQYRDSEDSRNVLTDDAVYDKLADLVQGIMLSIDNNMLAFCQNAANEAMLKVCGDTETCDNLVVDNGTGTRSFKYEVCRYSALDLNTGDIQWTDVCRSSVDGISDQELLNSENGTGWAGKLSGVMYWGDISYIPEENRFTNRDEYIEALRAAGQTVTEYDMTAIDELVFGKEMRALENAYQGAIHAIESDPTVQFCMTGREVQGMKRSTSDTRDTIGGRGEDYARFPELTAQMRSIIANSALKAARENYGQKYDEEIQRMMQDQVKVANKIDHQEAARVAAGVCEQWAESSALPKSKAPKASNAGKWLGFAVLALASIAFTVLTFGAGSLVAGIVLTSAAVGLTAGAASVAVDASNTPVGQKNVEQWNYKETITTTFNSETGECTKVRVYQNCEKVKKNYCEKWEDPTEVKDVVELY